jgi:hypothetical protein
MKKPGRNVVLIGSIYAGAVILLLLAIAAITGLLPASIAPVAPAVTAIAQAAPTAAGKEVPTLRPIWPSGNETSSVRRSTRTRTPSPVPTVVPVTPTWTPTPEAVALLPEASPAAMLSGQ